MTSFTVTTRASLANTGVTFDSRRGQLLHAVTDFDTDESYLLVTDLEVREVRRIPLAGVVRYAQGIAYDPDRDVTWVWGTKLSAPFQEWTAAFELAAIDRDGNVVERRTTPLLDAYPGMLAWADGNVWLKANTVSTAHLYDPAFTLLREVDTGVEGEGVAVDRHGSLWVHGNTPDRECLIRRITVDDVETSWPSPSPNCGAEGMTFDDEGNLWISTDDEYHYGTPGGNMVWRLTPEYFK